MDDSPRAVVDQLTALDIEHVADHRDTRPGSQVRPDRVAHGQVHLGADGETAPEQPATAGRTPDARRTPRRLRDLPGDRTQAAAAVGAGVDSARRVVEAPADPQRCMAAQRCSDGNLHAHARADARRGAAGVR